MKKINRKKQIPDYIKSKLSLQAKGLLLFIMSFPSFNDFYNDILKYNNTSKEEIDNILKELQEYGYYKDNTFYEYPVLIEKSLVKNAIDKSLVSYTAKPLIALRDNYNDFISNIEDIQRRWNELAIKRKFPKWHSIEVNDRKAKWKKVLEKYPYSDIEFWNNFFNNLDKEEITEYATKVYNNKKFFSSDFFIRQDKFERVEELANGTLINKEKKGISSVYKSDDNDIFDDIKPKIL